jgi:hypothetical protein
MNILRLVLVSLVVVVGSALTDTVAQAQGPITVAFDMDPTGNVCPGSGNTGGTDCTIPSIDNCVQVADGASFDFDIVLQGLPSGRNYATPDFYIGWSPPSPAPPVPYSQFPMDRFTLNSRTLQTLGINLLVDDPGSGIIYDASIPVIPPPHSSSPDRTFIADYGVAETSPPFTQGVVGRYNATVAGGTAAGIYGLIFDLSLASGGPVYVYDEYSQDMCTDPGCTLLDANVGRGLVAVNTPCPAAPAPVGGIAELPDGSDSSARSYIALAALAAAALAALSAAAWYARRRLS